MEADVDQMPDKKQETWASATEEMDANGADSSHGFQVVLPRGKRTVPKAQAGPANKVKKPKAAQEDVLMEERATQETLD